MQREILEPDVTIQVVPEIQLLQKSNGNLAPNLNHAGQKVGIVEIERSVKPYRERDRLVGVIDFQVGEMRIG
jgi:hypothetical protein